MRPIGLQICWVYMRIVRRMVLSEMETKECFHEGAGGRVWNWKYRSFIDAVEQTVDQRRAETEWKHADAWKKEQRLLVRGI